MRESIVELIREALKWNRFRTYYIYEVTGNRRKDARLKANAEELPGAVERELRQEIDEALYNDATYPHL